MEVKGVPVNVLGMGYPRRRDGGTGRDINGLGLEESTSRNKIFKFQTPREKRKKIQKLEKVQKRTRKQGREKRHDYLSKVESSTDSLNSCQLAKFTH